MLKAIYAALALVLSGAAPAEAAPEGQWPQDAYGLTLPAADWVLVVPAKRGADGTVRSWDRTDSWSRQWLVPRATPEGRRTVATLGDSEDSRSLDGSVLDRMDAAALSALAAKYHAPAIAVAIADETGAVAVAGWMEGHGASWLLAEGGGDPRAATLAAIDAIFSGEEEDSFDAEITGQRMAEGRMEYRVVADPVVIEAIAGIEGLEVNPYGEPGVAVVSVPDGRDIETALRDAGIELRRP